MPRLACADGQPLLLSPVKRVAAKGEEDEAPYSAIEEEAKEISPKINPAGDGMTRVAEALVEQHALLSGIVEMQLELRSLVHSKHEELEKRFDELRPFGGLGGLDKLDMESPPPEAEAEDEATALSQSGILSIGASHQSWWGGKSHVSTRARAGSKERSSATSKDAEEDPKPRSLREMLRKVLSHPVCDMVTGILIVMNFAAIFAELEWRGSYLAYRLNHPLDGTFPDEMDAMEVENAEMSSLFKTLEKCFNGIFMGELVVHLFAFKDHCRQDPLHYVDMFAILLSAADSFLFDPLLDAHSTKALTLLRLARVLRALRLLRFLRVLRFMGMFGALRVLVLTIRKSIGCLIWSMVIVGFIVLSAGMFMAQISQDILTDKNLSSELRWWVHGYYGGAFRASYTMFEATFSAKWATHFSERLIEEVSPWFSVFWILYTVTVTFAVVRVISALFLKQTLDVAAVDAERVVAMKLKEQEKITATLRSIFNMGDQIGDGVLQRWEFEEMMENEEILEKFESLELEAPELYMLFNILAEDDGVADQEEFLACATKLKTSVQTVDVVHLLHEQLVIKRYMAVLAEGLQRVDRALHPRNPWKPSLAHQPHFATSSTASS